MYAVDTFFFLKISEISSHFKHLSYSYLGDQLRWPVSVGFAICDQKWYCSDKTWLETRITLKLQTDVTVCYMMSLK